MVRVYHYEGFCQPLRYAQRPKRHSSDDNRGVINVEHHKSLLVMLQQKTLFGYCTKSWLVSNKVQLMWKTWLWRVPKCWVNFGDFSLLLTMMKLCVRPHWDPGLSQVQEGLKWGLSKLRLTTCNQHVMHKVQKKKYPSCKTLLPKDFCPYCSCCRNGLQQISFKSICWPCD